MQVIAGELAKIYGHTHILIPPQKAFSVIEAQKSAFLYHKAPILTKYSGRGLLGFPFIYILGADNNHLAPRPHTPVGGFGIPLTHASRQAAAFLGKACIAGSGLHNSSR
jgi:hypothetical protein